MKHLRIGGVAIGGLPRIVGTLLTAHGVAEAVQPGPRDFDLLEIRADIVPADRIRSAAAAAIRAGLPLVLTIRSGREGGHWRRSEAERKALYRAHLSEADAVDVEIRSPLMRPLAQLARRRRKVVIGSFHDFRKTPSLGVLRRVIARGRAAGADIVKLAVRVRSPGDLERLRGLVARSRAPLCVVGLGPLGAPARLELARAGSCLTYGYVDRAAAPGQPSCRALAASLRRTGLRAG